MEANARLIAAAPELYSLVRAHALAYPYDEYSEKIAEVIAKIEGELWIAP
jgi:ligand-binding sensor domain-containing protein